MSASRIILRATAAAVVPRTRPFTTTSSVQKTATEAVKDSVKKVDRTISNAAVKGIEVGEAVTEKTKRAVGYGTEKAKGKAGEAKGTAGEAARKVKGKAEEGLQEDTGF